MPTTKQQRRRALELLEASIDGCTEAIMLAYGFKIELLIELINAGFATTSIERMVAGGRRIEVTRLRITGLAGGRWRSFDGPDSPNALARPANGRPRQRPTGCKIVPLSPD